MPEIATNRLTPMWNGTTPTILDLKVTEDSLSVSFSDGRIVSVPLSWYSRLSHAEPGDRSQWRLTGRGHGIHWAAVDEDISVDNILLGQPSGESAASFQKWQNWYRPKV